MVHQQISLSCWLIYLPSQLPINTILKPNAYLCMLLLHHIIYTFVPISIPRPMLPRCMLFVQPLVRQSEETHVLALRQP